MSVTIQTIISCDGCGKTFCDGDASHLSVGQQRATFRAHGWKRTECKDACPDCWESIQANRKAINFGRD